MLVYFVQPEYTMSLKVLDQVVVAIQPCPAPSAFIQAVLSAFQITVNPQLIHRQPYLREILFNPIMKADAFRLYPFDPTSISRLDPLAPIHRLTVAVRHDSMQNIDNLLCIWSTAHLPPGNQQIAGTHDDREYSCVEIDHRPRSPRNSPVMIPAVPRMETERILLYIFAETRLLYMVQEQRCLFHPASSLFESLTRWVSGYSILTQSTPFQFSGQQMMLNL